MATIPFSTAGTTLHSTAAGTLQSTAGRATIPFTTTTARTFQSLAAPAMILLKVAATLQQFPAAQVTTVFICAPQAI
ncbi:MAG: hypothetical protein IKN16_11060 [Selenomonadaceae bacterium]|nr:hypothetical protein [Selenomonadaceae bacterium]